MFARLRCHDRFLRSEKESFIRLVLWGVYVVGLLLSIQAFDSTQQSYLGLTQASFYLQGSFLWYYLTTQAWLSSIWNHGCCKTMRRYEVYLIKPYCSEKKNSRVRLCYLFIQSLLWFGVLTVTYLMILRMGIPDFIPLEIPWNHGFYHIVLTFLFCLMTGCFSSFFSSRFGSLVILVWLVFQAFNLQHSSPFYLSLQEIFPLPLWNGEFYHYALPIEQYLEGGFVISLLSIVILSNQQQN